MRKLKFRVWDGYEFWKPGSIAYKGYPALDPDGSNLKIMISGYRRVPDNIFIWQQYTGVKDMNGVEIYEGDTIHEITTYPGKGGLTLKFEIAFSDGAFFLGTRLSNGNFHPEYPLHTRKSDELKVIGNIYEN